MRQQRLGLLNVIDERAKFVAELFVDGKSISETILNTIIELYSSAKVERELQNDFFEAAYHTPITGELEFFISRILLHFSIINKLEWKILLRRQASGCAPDIRIQRHQHDIAIIEIKAKGGWIQPFLSSERYSHDRMRKSRGETEFEPDNLISNQRNQLRKYMSTFNLPKKNMFFLLPTLALVHRKKYKSELSDYYHYFSQTSDLPEENLILLSANRRLDLSRPGEVLLEPTSNFERMLNYLSKI